MEKGEGREWVLRPSGLRIGSYYPLESGQLFPGGVDLLRLGVDPVLQLQLGGEVTQQRHQILSVAGLDPTHLLLLLRLPTQTHTHTPTHTHTHTHTRGAGAERVKEGEKPRDWITEEAGLRSEQRGWIKRIGFSTVHFTVLCLRQRGKRLKNIKNFTKKWHMQSGVSRLSSTEWSGLKMYSLILNVLESICIVNEIRICHTRLNDKNMYSMESVNTVNYIWLQTSYYTRDQMTAFRTLERYPLFWNEQTSSSLHVSVCF